MDCIIVEDQAPAQRVLQKYIGDAGGLNVLGVFATAVQALDFLTENKVDLIFLDIHLPGISGMDFLKTLTNPPKVIFTTAFSDYAVESYEMNVVDYLVKPFSFQRFLKAVSKAKEKGREASSPKVASEFYIKTGHEFVKVNSDEVALIKSDMDYTEIHMDNKKLLSSETLQYWETKLAAESFVRVHKSYLVNTDKINKIAGNQIFLEGDYVVPIGRAYKESFLKRVMK